MHDAICIDRYIPRPTEKKRKQTASLATYHIHGKQCYQKWIRPVLFTANIAEEKPVEKRQNRRLTNISLHVAAYPGS